MTPELIGIITVGIALAALNFTMFNMINPESTEGHRWTA